MVAKPSLCFDHVVDTYFDADCIIDFVFFGYCIDRSTQFFLILHDVSSQVEIKADQPYAKRRGA